MFGGPRRPGWQPRAELLAVRARARGDTVFAADSGDAHGHGAHTRLCTGSHRRGAPAGSQKA